MEVLTSSSLAYADLTGLLQFSGVEVLVIDAEGYDCCIIESMIDYCTRNSEAWPDIIQFETWGHCNAHEHSWTEEDTVRYFFFLMRR